MGCSDSMWAALRYRSSHLSSSSPLLQLWKLGFPNFNHAFTSSTASHNTKELLELQEVEKILSDVRADNVKVIPFRKHCDWADFMVIATGRSTWHVKNIAQALIYKVRVLVFISSVQQSKGYKIEFIEKNSFLFS